MEKAALALPQDALALPLAFIGSFRVIAAHDDGGFTVALQVDGGDDIARSLDPDLRTANAAS